MKKNCTYKIIHRFVRCFGVSTFILFYSSNNSPAQFFPAQQRFKDAALLLTEVPEDMLLSNLEEKEVPDLLFIITLVKELPEILNLSQQNELETIFAESGPWASSWAESLLMDFGIFESYDPIYLPDEIPLEERRSRMSPSEVPTKVKCYPNPATDLIFVRGQVPISALEMFDVTGKSVLTKKCNTESLETFLDIQNLSSGVYQLRVELNDGESMVTTIAIEK